MTGSPETPTASSSDAGTTSALLNALADAVEAAEGPSRELDVRIAVAIDWRWDDWEEGEPTAAAQAEKLGLDWLIGRCINGYASMWRHLPRYTASLDAAMTLAPEGPRRFIEQQTFKSGAANEPERSFARISVFTAPLIKMAGEGRSATPARALTAACLRARAVQP